MHVPRLCVRHVRCCHMADSVWGRQVIIFLYLVEEDTSYVILFSSFLGLVIEFWKLTQAMSISLDFSGPYPRLKFADKSSYTCAPLIVPAS